MTKDMASVYNPGVVEQKWYHFWLEHNCFVPEDKFEKPPFSIVMPPPNVTGTLHLGHALNNTLQDILTRWRRMQGYNALWLPGTDHAGIATQARVEESLAAEGLIKGDLGREKFVERVWEWKHNYGSLITNQLKMLGSSCDWTRERFTMDEGCSRAVRDTFVNLYEKGLIYQGDYIINWCPRCHTAISDIEVEHEEKEGHLWYVKYPVEDRNEFLVIATTRPETILGDSGVAVHPEDERYRHLIGSQVILPVLGRRIPVVGDAYVDMEFGTGALKITPAHDPNDFELGETHGLELILAMDESGVMNENAGPYQGMDRYTCRKQIVEDLNQEGFLVKVEDYRHAVGHCQRCNTVIEPRVSTQWFVKMKPLAEPAIDAVVKGDIEFVPERFTRVYLNWMENIRDWCISRQLWWGHRIPVWYCSDCGEVIVSKEDPVSCPSCSSSEIKQDEDVLDTWFSSALWPFSTLGWPDDTRDMQYFYPTSVLVTGRDIIFFWVARMIFSGLEQAGDIPFKYVNIHGLVLDALGRKMSKSLDNGIDPIEVIEKYGADTLRFSLITGVSPGNDVRFYWEKVENTRNFSNKIWNAARFVLMNIDDYEELDLAEEDLSLADRWILSRLHLKIDEITQLLEKFELGEAANTLYDFVWDEFCDWYIELAKPRLTDLDNPRERLIVQQILCRVLLDITKLLHPFMPFITEEIYQHLPGRKKTIMLDEWPRAQDDRIWPDAMSKMQEIMDIIRSLRSIRASFNIKPGIKADVILQVRDPQLSNVIIKNQRYIKDLAQVGEVSVWEHLEDKPRQAASALTGIAEIYVPLEGIIDFAVEIKRLEKELKAAEVEYQKAENKLNNEQFLSKAPTEIIAKEHEKLDEAKNLKAGIMQRLSILNN